ncbi:MAG: aldehyde dehydrogenase family protein [Pseudomonadota bacterium]
MNATTDIKRTQPKAQTAAKPAQDPRLMPTRNPRTGKVDYWATAISEDELEQTCSELRRNQKAWTGAGLEHRLTALRQWADEIERRAKDIGQAEFLDTGRHRLSHEVPLMVAAGLRDWCVKAPAILEAGHRDGRSASHPNVTFKAQLVACPLVGIISPWNHPFLLATLDAIPALIAGSAVIVKPSEVTPRFVDPVMESVKSVPELFRILRFVTGDASTGQAIVERADMVCFTGSITTGRKIAEACARRLIPLYLEMGGKDAAIVAPGADIDRAATAILRGSAYATGQICFSTERVYVHKDLHDSFVDLLVKKSDALRLSFPDPHSGHIGPFIFEKQAAVVDRHIDDALAKGAKLLTGGKSEVLGGGMYMKATVLTDVTHDMLIMKEETFGPVTPVMRYSSEDEAVALANDSSYGLSAAVFAGTAEQAAGIASRVEAGAISLQDAAVTIAILRDAEKTSFKQSALGGSRMGPNAILRFFTKKVLVLNSGPTADMQDLAERAA